MGVYDLKWMAIAQKELGIKEVPGDGDNPRILQYHKEGAPKLRAQADSVPWCAAFVGFCLKQAGIKGTGEAAARSYLRWGVPLRKFKPGCVVVFKRGSSSWQGHVAFGLSESNDFVQVIGGNQGDAVTVSKYAKSSLLGYRWCEEFDAK